MIWSRMYSVHRGLVSKTLHHVLTFEVGLVFVVGGDHGSNNPDY